MDSLTLSVRRQACSCFVLTVVPMPARRPLYLGSTKACRYPVRSSNAWLFYCVETQLLPTLAPGLANRQSILEFGSGCTEVLAVQIMFVTGLGMRRCPHNGRALPMGVIT